MCAQGWDCWITWQLCTSFRGISLFSTVPIYIPILFFFLMYIWLCWVFAFVQTFSSCSEEGYSGCSAWPCHWWPLSLQSRGSRVHRLPWLQLGLSSCGTHRLSCSAVCGVFLDQEPNTCPLHRQVDSSPLSHQGSPVCKEKEIFMWEIWDTSIVKQMGFIWILIQIAFLF